MNRTEISMLRHVLAAAFLLLLVGPGRGAEATTAVAVAERADAAFRSRLHEYAVATGGMQQPGYFAIVRRGLDQYDLRPRTGNRSAASGVDLPGLNAAPEPIDLDPNGQVLTSLRLGIRPEANTRIVNGFELRQGQYDEVVMLTGNDFLCSGIALNRTTILTAAHCACDLHLAKSDGSLRDSKKKVVLGLSNVAGAKDRLIDLSATRFISVDLFGVSPCPDIRPGLQAGHPDLALVRLQEGLSVDAPRLKVATNEIFEASLGRNRFYVIGFGCTRPIQPNGRFYNCDSGSTGKKFAASINTSGQCSNPGPPDGCAPGGKEFALRDEARRADTCAGDSGGPVVLDTGRAFFLAGITSRALDPNGTCGEGGIYEKITTAQVVDWLANSGIVP